MIATPLVGIAMITTIVMATTLISIAMIITSVITTSLMITPTVNASAWIVLMIQTVIVSACPAASRDTCRAVVRTV